MSTRVSADDSQTSTKTIEVQLLTQADFDAMSASRQAFIRDRIAAGQVKIVSPETITPPPPPPKPTLNLKMNQKMRPKTNDAQPKPTSSPAKPHFHPSSIRRLVGKNVKIVLNDGQIRTSVLAELWQFELVLKPTPNSEIILMKHAIATIEEDINRHSGTAPAGENQNGGEPTRTNLMLQGGAVPSADYVPIG